MKRIMCVSAFYIVLILGTFVYAQAGPLPDTGQTKCYDNFVEITCPEAGEDFHGQDASYLINPPSYTKLDAEGDDLPDSATEWSMVRDNVTGLIWEVKTDDGSIHDKDTWYTWQNAQDVFIAELNSSSFGEHSDWRVPTIKELASIIDYGKITPNIDANYFPNTLCKEASYYWSSTTDASRTSYAWGIFFCYGHNYGRYYKLNSYYVRAVRGGQARSFDNLVINGDGTVTATSTGLMWQQATSSVKNWKSALSYCEDLDLAGYSDWRLPIIKALQSIVDYSRSDPAIGTAYFPDTLSSGYWSSTTTANNTSCAWRIHFYYGADYYNYKSDGRYVRAVRGGQTQISGHLLITAPAQASSWNIGNSMAITWDTQSIPGNVKISISRQAGKDGTFETIAESTENDGTYNWTVAGTASVNCVLKIEPIDDSSKGTTQGLFTIYNVPTLSTDSATSVTTNSAILNGTVNPNGSSTTYYFQYGTTTSYGSTTTSTSAGTGTSDVSVNASLTGLTSEATYYFRIVATNSAGTTYGDDQTFTTSAPPVIAPTVTTGSATSVTASSATLNGMVNPNGVSATYYFEYGTNTSYGSTTSDKDAGSGLSDVSVTANLTGLSAGTAYHYRLVATNNAETAYGSDHTFTTSALKPTLSIGLGTGTRGEKTTLPITLSNVTGTDIAAVSVDVGYDTSVFQKLKATIGPAGDAEDKTISTSEPSSGVFRVTIFSISNNNVIGDGVVAYLTLDILSNEPGSETTLTNTPSASDPSGNDVVVKGTDGTVKILGYLAGDCNGDGTVSVAEVQLAINMALGITPIEDCVDVNGNGKVSIGEVQKVINNHLGISAADFEVFPPDSAKNTGAEIMDSRIMARSGSSVPSLSLSWPTGAPGDTVTVSVSFTNASGYQISAILTDISYDTSVLENLTVEIGPAGSAAGKTVISNEISSGNFRIGVLLGSNNIIADGIVAYLTFDIRADASLGQTTLENFPEASDPSGNDVPISGNDGVIQVTTNNAGGDGGGGGGCFISTARR